jgi:sulfatase maturation enzyme AslB (radical SAM superfamily)
MAGNLGTFTAVDSAVLHDADRLEAVRAMLAEYDIVATGIKTIRNRLAAVSFGEADTLRRQLEQLEVKFDLQREALWRLQISDVLLSEFISEMLRRGRGEDPFRALSQHIDVLKMALSRLVFAMDALPERLHEFRDTIEVSDRSDDRLENIERVAYEIAFGRTQLASSPLRMIFDTTSRCNLRCVTCHQSATQEVIHYDLADADLRGLDLAVERASQVFIAGMGEPLLSRATFDLVGRARSSGAYVETITNGTTLARGWRLLPNVDMLYVSFDGGTPESYEAVRRHGSFHRLIAGLRGLLESERRKICFNVVVCRQNVFTIPDIMQLATSLNIGHVHLQEMSGYLAWHDRMLIGEAERSWLFKWLAGWRATPEAAGLSFICNLVPPGHAEDAGGCDTHGATKASIAEIADVPAPTLPARQSLQQISTDLEKIINADIPATFRAVKASVRRLVPSTAEAPPPDRSELDWTALRDHVEADLAAMPHCFSTYAHLVVNGDATTRSCCKVQSRLASVDAVNFDDVWNAPTYVELRTAHAAQIAPRKACEDCRDPVRFHFLTQVLEVLDRHEIDITLIRRPKDFPIPASAEEHPLVRQLGRNAIAAP